MLNYGYDCDTLESYGYVCCSEACADDGDNGGDGGGDGSGDCEFFDCEGQEACGYEGWLGDGLCDDGTWGIYFNCDEFNNDEGDCDDDGGGADGCADGEFECNDGTCIVGTYENDGWCDCSQCEDDLGAGGCYEDGDCCDCTFPENCPDDCDDGGGDGECPEGTVDDCSGDGDCCPESWIGDGWMPCDGIDQPYGCDLTCYDNDGGDCDESSDEGCWEDGELYCYGCELWFSDCEFYECTEDGWAGPYSNDECDDNGDSIVTLSIGDAVGISGDMPGEGIQFGAEVPLFYTSTESRINMYIA